MLPLIWLWVGSKISKLCQRFEAALESIRDEVDIDQRDEVDAWAINAKSMRTRSESQTALWESYSGAAEPNSDDPWARWLRGSPSGSGVDFFASPVLARDLLSLHIWHRAAGWWLPRRRCRLWALLSDCDP